MRLGIDGLLAATLLAAAGWRQVDACGPWFPNRVLNAGDEAVLTPPVANFWTEMERVRLSGKAEFLANVPSELDKPRQTTDTDLAELRAALGQTDMSATDREDLFSRYQDIREEIWDYARDLAKYNELRAFGFSSASQPAELVFDEQRVPDGLPAEFADYLRGAIAYHRKRYADARQRWTALLDRPAEQRRNRTVWAAYMLGRSWVDEKPEEAVAWFEKTRALAREGFRDSTGLAAASFGWQARAELLRGRYEEAISLYLEQARAGDRGAYLSLGMVVRRLSKADQAVLARVAKHPLSRQVVTIYVVSSGGARDLSPDSPSAQFPKLWLSAVEQADAQDMPEAERLAWLAYQCDDMELAGRWLQRAPQASPVTKWLQAKLLLYDGKIEPAVRLLAEAARQLPTDESWRDPLNDEYWSYFNTSPRSIALSELGVLHLARHHYVEALDTLLRGRRWLDGSYVAERVLTIEELIRYVDDHYPAGKLPSSTTMPDDYYSFPTSSPQDVGLAMRYLLARRLCRMKRYDEARKYYPAARLSDFDALVSLLKAGRSTTRPKTERSRSLWEAAQLARRKGMELMGTEVEPDWYSLDKGTFELEGSSAIRTKPSAAEVVPPTSDERKRLARHSEPRKRFHYRYVAADLAWEAAELMPNESEETAKVLCEAGSWLKVRDPKAADRFYKALVRRCGTTPLGKKATELKWFPKLRDDDPEDLQATATGPAGSNR